MSTTQEKILVMQAFLNGQKVGWAIHWDSTRTGVLAKDGNPSWDWADREYKILPIKKTAIQKALAAYRNNFGLFWIDRRLHCNATRVPSEDK